MQTGQVALMIGAQKVASQYFWDQILCHGQLENKPLFHGEALKLNIRH
jgi:hypothetical protein